MKRKILTGAAAALLALFFCASALAGGAVEDAFDQVKKLLFDTSNVTLKITADFSLDGNRFKTAEITLIQDRDRAFRQMLLSSPREDGTERKNGYTIVVTGEDLYLMEVYTPDQYRTGTTDKRQSILRGSVATEQLLPLAKLAAREMDEQLGDGAVSRTDGNGIRIELDGNVPAIADVALDVFAGFAARRYFRSDFDQLSPDGMRSIYNFTTLTQGLLYCTRSVSLRNLSVTIKPDAEGELQSAEGTAFLLLDTVENGTLGLEVAFRAEVTDRGTSMVRKFNPEDYGVTLTPGSFDVDNPGYLGFEYDEGGMTYQAQENAQKWLRLAGYDLDPFSETCNITFEEGRSYLEIMNRRDEVEVSVYATTEDQLLELYHADNNWQNLADDLYQYDPQPDPEMDRKAKEAITAFLQEVNPEGLKYAPDLKMEYLLTLNGETYAQYHEDPLDQEGHGVLFMVRLEPEWRIEYYSCISNG